MVPKADFLTALLVVALTFDLLTSKSKQLVFFRKRTKVVKLGEIPPSGL